MARLLTHDEVTTQLFDLEGWEQVGDALVRSVELADFAAALDFVAQVGHESEAMQHHPDLEVHDGTVRLSLSTADAGGTTQLDVELAHRVDSLLG